MKPKNGLVNFLRKVEGKPPSESSVSISKNFKSIPFPQVDDFECFKNLCYSVFRHYLPGEHLRSEVLRSDVDYGFVWDTGPIEWTLWKEMYESGYIHPECYDCLYSWHKRMMNGEEPQLEYEDDEAIF